MAHNGLGLSGERSTRLTPGRASTARVWTVAGTTDRHTAGCCTSATIPLITMRRRTCWRISCQPDPEWGPAPTLLLRPRECESTRVARTTPIPIVGLEGDANSAPRQAASNPTRGRRRPARLSLRRTHPRGGDLGRHFPLTVNGASLRHETSAVGTLIAPYRTAVEYGGVSSPGWAGRCRETRPGDRVRLGGRDDRRQDGEKVATNSCGRR